ncbi:hypothetical protein [Hymenobacter crusticola]|uniref:DUF4468 domain-containing protein n=1 Tax=Hymenobacter crusticola TaxID=1770526 RepID=A0A243WK55_9BACT|nr:hypothetical protein [Hymenobacter crusticola]OUJ76000.1 hypothetical protein BXP70_01590 [Hymenobacter crusticola]
MRISVSVLALLLSFITISSRAQTATTDLVPWSAKHRLTVGDFGVKLKKGNVGKAEFQLATEKRTNIYTHQKRIIVRNNMVRSASSINPNQHLPEQLRFQQTLFDIMEIYARQLRQATATPTTVAGTPKSPSPEERIVAAAAKRRQRYGVETQYGTLAAKQARWEKTIQQELAALQQFAVPE